MPASTTRGGSTGCRETDGSREPLRPANSLRIAVGYGPACGRPANHREFLSLQDDSFARQVTRPRIHSSVISALDMRSNGVSLTAPAGLLRDLRIDDLGSKRVSLGTMASYRDPPLTTSDDPSSPKPQGGWEERYLRTRSLHLPADPGAYRDECQPEGRDHRVDSVFHPTYGHRDADSSIASFSPLHAFFRGPLRRREGRWCGVTGATGGLARRISRLLSVCSTGQG